MEQQYTVRVVCMTYNHAPYIEDAMNGFCMQETSFPFVCIIVDDASTDGEQEVIQGYLNEHFILSEDKGYRRDETEDYIRIFARHKTNSNCYFVVVYLKYNHYSIKKPKMPYFKEWTNTEYIALCEGDDYWIDPLKLQKQVGFLESNPDYGLCCTEIGVKNQIKGCVDLDTQFCDLEDITFIDLLSKNNIFTLTVLYKKKLGDQYINEIKPAQHNWKMGDYPTWLWFSCNSKIKCLQDRTSVYRIASGSASHNTSLESQLEFLKSTIDIQLFFMDRFGLPKDKKNEIFRNVVNGITKTALLKKNNLIYKYELDLKKKNNIRITLFDKFCGLLLSNKLGIKLLDVYTKQRVDYY